MKIENPEHWNILDERPVYVYISTGNPIYKIENHVCTVYDGKGNAVLKINI